MIDAAVQVHLGLQTWQQDMGWKPIRDETVKVCNIHTTTRMQAEEILFNELGGNGSCD